MQCFDSTCYFIQNGKCCQWLFFLFFLLFFRHFQMIKSMKCHRCWRMPLFFPGRLQRITNRLCSLSSVCLHVTNDVHQWHLHAHQLRGLHQLPLLRSHRRRADCAAHQTAKHQATNQGTSPVLQALQLVHIGLFILGLLKLKSLVLYFNLGISTSIVFFFFFPQAYLCSKTAI